MFCIKFIQLRSFHFLFLNTLWLSLRQVVAYAPVDVKLDAKAGEIHRIDCLNMLTYTILLICTVLTIWMFKLKKTGMVHETALTIFYGLIVGAIICYFGDTSTQYTYLRVQPISQNSSNLASEEITLMPFHITSTKPTPTEDTKIKVPNIEKTGIETPKNIIYPQNMTLSLAENTHKKTSPNLTPISILTTTLSKSDSNQKIVMNNTQNPLIEINTSISQVQNDSIFYENSPASVSAPPDSLWLPLVITQRDNKQNISKLYVYTFKGELVHAAQSAGETYIGQKATFDPELFYNLVLPPIILNAGYSMQRGNFFRNMPAISSLAFLGTALSAFCVALVLHAQLAALRFLRSVIIYAFPLPAVPPLGLTDCLYFGGLISATDPVAVLSILNSVDQDVRLHTLVLGESVLNDAVAIALVRAVERLQAAYAEYPLTSPSWSHAAIVATSRFCQVLLLSLLLGVLVGVICALLTKHTRLRDYPPLEVSLFVLCSYGAFLLCELLQLSGIVAILFCGICQAHYTRHNLSIEAKQAVRSLTQILAFLAENFIFAYLGVSTFTHPAHRWSVCVILCALIATVFARAVCVYGLSFALNRACSPDKSIPIRYQHVLFFSGMRGAMAYSLAMRNTFSEARKVILSTTSALAIITIVVGGTFSKRVVNILKVEGEAVVRKNTTNFNNNNNNSTPKQTSDPQTDPYYETGEMHQNGWFMLMWLRLDSFYLIPLLTNYGSPTLVKTLPRWLLPLARILTTTEQLSREMDYNDEEDRSNGFSNLNFTGSSVRPSERVQEAQIEEDEFGNTTFYQRYSFDNNNYEENNDNNLNMFAAQAAIRAMNEGTNKMTQDTEVSVSVLPSILRKASSKTAIGSPNFI